MSEVMLDPRRVMVAGLRASLVTHAADWRSIGAQPGAWLMLEFVGRVGVAYIGRALPRQYTRRIPKQCFANAAALVKRAKDLTYVEGFVAPKSVPFPIHHAWAIDCLNRIVDPTLSEPEFAVYVGLPITPEEYAAETSRFGDAAVLCSGYGAVNLEFILSKCPAIEALMPKGAA